MIDLSEYRKVRQLTLPGGVVVTCKPLKLREMQMLRETSHATVLRGVVGRDEVEAADGEVFGIPDPANDAAVRAHQTTLFIHDLAKETITEWTGVKDGGSDLKATAGNIDEYLDYVPGAAETFLMKYMAPYIAVDVEGNEFGSGPAGNGDLELNDAPPVETKSGGV